MTIDPEILSAKREAEHRQAQAAARETERRKILEEAADLVAGARDLTYGTPERNLGRISTLWSFYLGTPVSPRQVAMMMVLLKVARDMHLPKRDNLVDLAGYAALAGELLDAEGKEVAQ